MGIAAPLNDPIIARLVDATVKTTVRLSDPFTTMIYQSLFLYKYLKEKY
jgi:hypothetical protein